MTTSQQAPPPATPSDERTLDGLVLAAVSAAAFGVSGALGKGLLEAGWSSGAVVTARNGLGAVLLAPVTVRALRTKRLEARQRVTVLLYGLLAVAGTQVFFFNAVARLSVGVALMVEYLAPFLLVGWAWTRTGVRPGARTLLGGALALVGMGLVVDLLGTADVDFIGLGWAMGAAVGLATYYYVSARPMDGVPSVALAGGGIAAGTLLLAGLGVAGVLPMRASTSDAVLLGSSRPWWLIVVALGVISCAVAYTTGIVAAHRLGERVASFVGLTEVLFAVLFAWVLLEELPGLLQLGGGLLVLAGLALVRTDGPARQGDPLRFYGYMLRLCGSGPPEGKPEVRTTTGGHMAQGTRRPISTTARRGSGRAVACLIVCGVLAASCSGDRGSGGEAVVPAGSETSGPAAGTDGTTFGTLESPCGPGEAAGATATGVTDESITIGYGDDAGFAAAPGLSKEISDAMAPMIDWCNDQGGINGREVVGNYYDAKATEVDAAITGACNDEVFMLVGQGWVLDSGAEQARIECEIASIPAFVVSTSAAHGPGTVQPVPSPGDQVPASAAFQMAELFPEAITKAAFVFAEFPATRETRDKYAASFPEAGWEFQDCDQVYGVTGEADWKPFASNLEACGIEAVVWVGSPNPNFQNFLSAAQQVGFEPTAYLSDTNQYDTGFAEWSAGSNGAGDNVYIRMGTVPFEQADEVPAVQQYLDIVEADGGRTAVLGVQATSAFLLWATGVQACGSDVTQACVLDQVAEQTEWTAGGLHGPTDPAANESTACGLLLKLDGGDFEKVVPEGDEVFDCQDEYLVTGITTDALDAAQLDGDRVSTEFGSFTPT